MRRRGISHRILVVVFDLVMLLLINVALLVLYRTNFRYLGLSGVLAQMLLLAVHGDEKLRLEQAHDHFQFFLTGVTGNVDLFYRIIHDFGALSV